MKEHTLQMAKDAVARDLGWPDWWSLDFNKTNISQEVVRDKAAELYASKLSEGLQKEIERLEKENQELREKIK